MIFKQHKIKRYVPQTDTSKTLATYFKKFQGFNINILQDDVFKIFMSILSLHLKLIYSIISEV